MAGTRIERDFLGEVEVPQDALHGVHAARARENFPLALRPPKPELVHAFGAVKQACARTNRLIGALDAERAEAIERAAAEMAEGRLDDAVIVDALAGGAGTSLNMNVNEVLANRALQLLGAAPGDYARISPLDHVNLHQSTNDTFPTALRLAAIGGCRALEAEVLALQEAFQRKERAFAGVVKVGRTEMQDAVLLTLGREMSAAAEALGRDRWRIYKCEERLRVVNLGGTAVGTGLGAPRAYIFRVVDELRGLTGVGFARAENLVEATANADVFVEVSGLLKALAATLVKICGDLRLLSSGPEAGLGELRLPPRQAGSSIMPGKVNPVIPEAATQAALLAMGLDGVIAHAAALGSLELNPFLPLIADALLESCGLLTRAARTLRERCVEGLEADEARCRAHVAASTAAATALVPLLGYEGAAKVARRAAETGVAVREAAIALGAVTAEQFDELTSPEAVCRLGAPNGTKRDA